MNGGITVINVCNRKNLLNTEVNNDYEREGYKTFLAMKSVGVPEGTCRYHSTRQHIMEKHNWHKSN